MKRILLPILSLTVGIALTASANQIQVGYSGASYGPYQTTAPSGYGGGEFTFNDVNPEGWLDLSGYASTTKNQGLATITSFQTFCIERSETLSGYANTYNAVLNNAAVGGGGGAINGADILSVGTGWLYSQFAKGVLAGYNYLGTVAQRKTSAGLLQDAIWWLEEELATYSATNPFMQAVIAKFGSDVAARADGGQNYGVYAINLTTLSGARAQDGLYYTPEGGLTAALLGLALVGLDGFRRRLKA